MDTQIPPGDILSMETNMGTSYTWIEKCPNCGVDLHLTYFDGYDDNSVVCTKCLADYDICMTFKLIAPKRPKSKRKKTTKPGKF
jgi:hypothetical protein